MENRNYKIAYRLHTEKWVQFPVTNTCRSIKIVTFCFGCKDIALFPGDYSYSIAYSLRNKWGRTVFSDTIGYDVIIYDGNVFYQPLNKELTENLICGGRISVLDMDHISNRSSCKYICYKIITLDTLLNGVLLQQSGNELWKQNRNVDLVWENLTPARKKNIGKGNVFPYELIDNDDRYRILNNIWTPKGPLGIPGRDYIIIHFVDTCQEDSCILQYGNYNAGQILIDKSKPFTLPVVSEKDRYCFVFDAIAHTGMNSEIIIKNYISDSSTFIHSKTIQLKATGIHHDFNFEPGLAVIEAETPVFCRVIRNDSTLQIQNIYKLLKCFLVDSTGKLTYDVSYNTMLRLPVRIDCRALYIKGRSRIKDTVCVTLRDSKKNRIRCDTIVVDTLFSTFERLSLINDSITVSQKKTGIIYCSCNVKYLTVESKSTVAVSLYNRIYDLPRRTVFGNDGKITTPAWFPVYPVNDTVPVFLKKLSEPDTISHDTNNTGLEWKIVEPDKYCEGYYAVVPITPGKDSISNEAVTSHLHRLHIGNQEVHLINPYGTWPFKPSLIFMTDTIHSGKKPTIRLLKNGELFYEEALFSQNGRIILPSINKGIYAITLQADSSVRCFLSNVYNNSYEKVRRFVYKLTPDRKENQECSNRISVTLPISNRGIRSLACIIFRDHSDPDSTILRIAIDSARIESGGMYRQITLPVREYVLSTFASDTTYLLSKDGVCLDGGKTVVFPLYEDIDRGECRFQISLLSKKVVYVMFYTYTMLSDFSTRVIKELYGDDM